MSDKRIITKGQLDAGARGTLEAVISTFGGPPDHDGDIVEPTAFTNGQRVPLVWSHDWERPIGDGHIRVEPTRAVFSGRLWLDTDDGEQAWRKIKNAGELQEYSWGFQVLDAEPGTWQGQPVRVIRRTRVFEASPTLVGAAGVGRTGTLALKGGRRHAPDPALVAIRATLAAERAAEVAEVQLIAAELAVTRARERAEWARLGASVRRTLALARR